MARSDYWIKVFDSLPDHLKTRELCRRLGWNRSEGVGFLVRFWLLVASDAPDGVLTGLVEPDALLKALDMGTIERRRHIIAAMLDLAWLDQDEDGCYVVHHWEEGGGQLQKTRTGDRSRQRDFRHRQRGETNSRHSDVTDESKSKELETPPNPPQAGGEFKFFENFVWETWEAALAEVGRPCARDPKDTLGAGKIAKTLQAGKVGQDVVAGAFREFLKEVAADPKRKSWNLNTLANNLTPYLPKEQPAPPKPTAPPEEAVCWRFVCDVCGSVILSDVPVSDGTPGSRECFHGYRPGAGRKCAGMWRPVEIVPPPVASE